MLGHDDAQRTEHGQIDSQLSMPRGGHELKESVVPLGCREQEGITLLTFEDLLDGVPDAPVRAVHVTSHDEQHRDG